MKYRFVLTIMGLMLLGDVGSALGNENNLSANPYSGAAVRQDAVSLGGAAETLNELSGEVYDVHPATRRITIEEDVYVLPSGLEIQLEDPTGKASLFDIHTGDWVKVVFEVTRDGSNVVHELRRIQRASRSDRRRRYEY